MPPTYPEAPVTRIMCVAYSCRLFRWIAGTVSSVQAPAVWWFLLSNAAANHMPPISHRMGSAVWLHQLNPIAERVAHIPAFKPLQRLIVFQLVPGRFQPS